MFNSFYILIRFRNQDGTINTQSHIYQTFQSAQAAKSRILAWISKTRRSAVVLLVNNKLVTKLVFQAGHLKSFVKKMVTVVMDSIEAFWYWLTHLLAAAPVAPNKQPVRVLSSQVKKASA